MAKSFEAQISDWVRKTQRRTEGVFKESAQEVFRVAQKPVGGGGAMPIDTGFLRASLQVGLNGDVPTGSPSEGDIKIAEKGTDVDILTIIGARIGDNITGIWTANYAAAVHYGAKGRPGRLWVDLAAQQWQEIVARNARRAEALNS